MDVFHHVILDNVAKNINYVKLLKWTVWKQLQFINIHYNAGKLENRLAYLLEEYEEM